MAEQPHGMYYMVNKGDGGKLCRILLSAVKQQSRNTEHRVLKCKANKTYHLCAV